MMITAEREQDAGKLFEFEASRSCSILGHKVTVLDRAEDNVLCRRSAADAGTYFTLPADKLEELRQTIAGGWRALGDGRTEEMSRVTGYFVLDGYADRFYFANGSCALRAYIRMAGEFSRIPAESVPRARAVFTLFHECARLLQGAGVAREFFALVP